MATAIHSFQVFSISQEPIQVAQSWAEGVHRQVRFVNLTPAIPIGLSPDKARTYPDSLPLIATVEGQVEEHGGGWWASSSVTMVSAGRLLVIVEEPTQTTGPAGPAGPMGASVTSVGSWTWNTQTAPPPNTGQLRTNSGDWPRATILYFDIHMADNTDLTRVLPGLVLVGTTIQVQQKTDATRWATFKVASTPTNVVSYLSVPVTYVEGGTLAPGGTAELRVAFAPPPSSTFAETSL